MILIVYFTSIFILIVIAALEGTLQIIGQTGFESGAGVGSAIAALNSK